MSLGLCIIKDMWTMYVLFRSLHDLKKCNEYLNTKHANIKFTNEKVVIGS